MLKTGRSAVVQTTTADDTDGTLGDSKPCWLAPFLLYEFTLNHPNANEVKKGEVKFAALERPISLRFEFEVGRLIDDWNFQWGSEDLTDAYDPDDNPAEL